MINKLKEKHNVFNIIGKIKIINKKYHNKFLALQKSYSENVAKVEKDFRNKWSTPSEKKKILNKYVIQTNILDQATQSAYTSVMTNVKKLKNGTIDKFEMKEIDEKLMRRPYDIPVNCISSGCISTSALGDLVYKFDGKLFTSLGDKIPGCKIILRNNDYYLVIPADFGVAHHLQTSNDFYKLNSLKQKRGNQHTKKDEDDGSDEDDEVEEIEKDTNNSSKQHFNVKTVKFYNKPETEIKDALIFPKPKSTIKKKKSTVKNMKSMVNTQKKCIVRKNNYNDKKIDKSKPINKNIRDSDNNDLSVYLQNKLKAIGKRIGKCKENKDREPKVIGLDLGVDTPIFGVSNCDIVQYGTGLRYKIAKHLRNQERYRELIQMKFRPGKTEKEIINNDGTLRGYEPIVNDEHLYKILKRKKGDKYVDVKVNMYDKLNRNIIREEKKIYNLVKEFHNKSINDLVTNYKLIFVGDLDINTMINNKGYMNDNLRYILRKYRLCEFKNKLKHKCGVYESIYFELNEAYTSKCCSRCGSLNKNLGASKVFECGVCENMISRDYNGGKNILMKGLNIFNKN